MILSSIICALSVAPTYFPLDPPSLCLFGDKFFFGDLWKSIGVDISFWFEILISALRTVCSAPATAIPSCFLNFPYSWFFLVSFLNKCKWILKVPTNRLYRPSFRWLVWRATWDFFPGHDYVVRHFYFSISGHIYRDLFRWYWNIQYFPVGWVTLAVFD